MDGIQFITCQCTCNLMVITIRGKVFISPLMSATEDEEIFYEYSLYNLKKIDLTGSLTIFFSKLKFCFTYKNATK